MGILISGADENDDDSPPAPALEAHDRRDDAFLVAVSFLRLFFIRTKSKHGHSSHEKSSLLEIGQRSRITVPFDHEHLQGFLTSDENLLGRLSAYLSTLLLTCVELRGKEIK